MSLHIFAIWVSLHLCGDSGCGHDGNEQYSLEASGRGWHLKCQEGRGSLVTKQPRLHLFITGEEALARECAVQLIHPVNVIRSRHQNRCCSSRHFPCSHSA